MRIQRRICDALLSLYIYIFGSVWEFDTRMTGALVCRRQSRTADPKLQFYFARHFLADAAILTRRSTISDTQSKLGHHSPPSSNPIRNLESETHSLLL